MNPKLKTTLLAMLLCLGIAAQAAAQNSAADYNNSGIQKGEKGDLDGAMADLNRAIDLDPANAMCYMNRGIAKDAKGDVDGAIADFDRTIALNPQYTKAYYHRGVDRQAKDNEDGALADYNRAIALDPKFIDTYNSIAWLLATSHQPSLRNGAKAVEYATKACELNDWKDMNAIDTLAAACAENGSFDDAVKWETKYIAEAKPPDKDAPTRLALYQNHQPYHEPVPAAAAPSPTPAQ